jgi:serine-type D-Ala-D-Ala carboxypeptidase (penicillin-binding protein 5/6)
VSEYYALYQGTRKTHRLRRFVVAAAFLSTLTFGGYLTLSKLPSRESIKGTTLSQAVKKPVAEASPKLITPMPWPAQGYAAYSVPKDNLFAGSKDDIKPVPIASLAKIITVLAVMNEKPLATGEQGPMLTLDQRDIQLYQEYIQKDGTVVPVETGERLSQYQALQAVMLVSANNMSDSLAEWAFGSIDGYVAYANKMLKDYGFKHTVVADASGFSPKTVSTPEEMTRLGFLYMQYPVLREIATQEEAVIPVAGLIRSYNSFANHDGVIGIKVGFTEEAGRNYLAADIRHGGDAPEKISVAVVLGANSMEAAARDALAILRAGNEGHKYLTKNSAP